MQAQRFALLTHTAPGPMLTESWLQPPPGEAEGRVKGAR